MPRAPAMNVVGLPVVRATTAKTVAEAQLADTIRRLRLDVTIAAIDVLEAKAKLRLARENLDALDQLVYLNERRLTSGATAR